MALSNDLISQFVKVTKDKAETKSETIVYGTVQESIAPNGLNYVKIDGSDLLTPVSSTTVISANDRVTILVKNHTAVVTGNLTSPAVRKEDAVDVSKLNAQTARINELETANAAIEGTLTANSADIETLKTNTATISGKVTANEAEIATLKSTSVSAEVISSTYATIASLNTQKGRIDTLETEKLSASDIEGKYANIDFSNISKATMGQFYADSGLIQNVVVGESTITGKLVGVTISGDLIEGNTVKAEKLVIKGSDGLYYKLNTDGVTTEAQQTNQNSLDGSVIKAKTITATKVNVSDLVAFGATIGGFNITDSAIYSGAKTTPGNTTRGIYLGKDAQASIGDGTSYIKYYKDTDGSYKLAISADSMVLASGTDVQTTINELSQSTRGNSEDLTAYISATNSKLEELQGQVDASITIMANSIESNTNFLNLSTADGLVVGDRTAGTLKGNIQLKAETGGASISLRDGTTILTKFSATSKAFTGVTSATTTTSSVTESTEGEDGTATSETIVSASQTIIDDQTKSVVKFESANPIYFSQGIATNGVIINDDSLISNVDFTLNGRIFDKNGKSAFEPITGAGNLSIGYGRYKAATASSTDSSILYGNQVRLAAKKNTVITYSGSTALDTMNANGNMVVGYHLYKKGSGNLHLYAGDNVMLRAKQVYAVDSTGNTVFEAKNSSGNTTLGYARYVNGGETNIYGGSEINLSTNSGNIVSNCSIIPSANSYSALGKYNEKGWSNIYIGNSSGVYNGLRMIVDGASENMCGRDGEGRYIFGNNGSIMYYYVKNVSETVNGTGFRFTSGNFDAGNNSVSTWLFGAADSTSRYMGSYLAYNRTYTASANMVVTSNGVFGRNSSSSQRYKRDIITADIDELKGLYDLPIKKFKYKSDYIAPDDELYDKYLYGFIVEDLEDVLPCAVQHELDADGKPIPEMWNNNVIVPSLLKLIQDLNDRLKKIEMEKQ